MEKKDLLRIDVYGAKERSIEELAWVCLLSGSETSVLERRQAVLFRDEILIKDNLNDLG